MKKTTTRLVIERQKLTVLRPPIERTAVSYPVGEAMLTESRNHSNRQLPKKLIVPLGLVIWLAGCFVIDLIVLQIFPVPADVWRNNSTAEIIASRPTAAVAMNFCGQLIALAVVVFGVTRFTKHSATYAGALMILVVMTLAVVNALVTRNLRWPGAMSLVLLPVVGYIGTRLGAR